MSKPKPAPALLIVDDDQGLLRLASKALSREGFAVATAGSGTEAVDWLKDNEPSLLLLDLKLQDFGAQEIISQLAVLKRLPPFLIITGQGDERVAVEMMKGGARDYLVKGKDFLDLLPAVVTRVLQQIQSEAKLAAAEAALRVNEQRFRVALKHSPIMVFNQDADLRYSWVHNVPAGLTETSLIGKTDSEIFLTEEADRLSQIKARVLMTGTGLREEIACTVGGRKLVYDLTVEALRDATGRIIGITGAAMDITERKRLEDEVLHISEMEQRRIGQDLHDGICQHLAGIELKSQVLEQNLRKKAKEHAVQAEQIAKHVRDAIGETRSLARSLSPFILESEGLISALRELAANTERLFDVKCSFVSKGPISLHSQATATHLYRIAQEAVANAAKHAKATVIEISLSVDGDQIILLVNDNGSGFVERSETTTGMGLRIMKYRAGVIGGTLLIQRQPSGGTRVVCFLHQ